MEYDMFDRNSLDHEMSTSGRGTINPAERGNLIGSWETVEHPTGSNAFMEPDSCYDYGGCDPSNEV